MQVVKFVSVTDTLEMSDSVLIKRGVPISLLLPLPLFWVPVIGGRIKLLVALSLLNRITWPLIMYSAEIDRVVT